MKIISESRYERHVEYTLEFVHLDSPNAGFSFPCDAQGLVDLTKLHPAALENYNACLAGTNGTKGEGLQTREHSYRVAAVGKCPCGAEVVLSGFTNTCGCGRDFNGSGDELASCEQWGEETGEHWTECL